MSEAATGDEGRGGGGAGGPSVSDPGDGSDLRRDLLRIGGFLLVTYVGFFVLGTVGGVALGEIVGTLTRITLFTAAFSLLTLALNLHWGYTGIFNIGIAGFMAVGVYTMAVLTAPPDPVGSPVGGLDMSVWVGILGGVLAAAGFGALLSLPALRVRADYFAIITLGFSEIVRLSLLSGTLREIPAGEVVYGTGGGRGIRYKSPSDEVVELLFDVPVLRSVGTGLYDATEAVGLSTTQVDRLVYALVVLGFVLITFVVLRRVIRSPFGRVLKAIREDEVVARSLGKNTPRTKVKAFTLGAAVIGLGGILWLGRGSQITPNDFRPIVTFYVFIALIIGGQGSNLGSMVGGFAFAAFLFEGPRFLRTVVTQNITTEAPATIYDALIQLGALEVAPLVGYLAESLDQLRWIVVGVILILLMIYRPEGLFGDREETAAAATLSRRGAGATGRERVDTGAEGQPDGGEQDE
ncbi:MAG: branched-chain amino acid transport system permease protein [Natronomonas sp.]|jgi:branched-chain amino acid transport system permease protein